jgi:hypothetical protein
MCLPVLFCLRSGQNLSVQAKWMPELSSIYKSWSHIWFLLAPNIGVDDLKIICVWTRRLMSLPFTTIVPMLCLGPTLSPIQWTLSFPRGKTSGTVWSWALLERPSVLQLLKNFSAFYGTQRFSTALTRALHFSLFWARIIQSIPPHPVSPRSMLVLSLSKCQRQSFASITEPQANLWSCIF